MPDTDPYNFLTVQKWAEAVSQQMNEIQRLYQILMIRIEEIEDALAQPK